MVEWNSLSLYFFSSYYSTTENESTPNHTAAPQEEEEEGSLSTIVEEDEEAPAPPAGNTNPSTKKSSGGTKSSLKSDTSSADDTGASKGRVTFVFGESQTTSSDSTATPKSKSVKQRVAEFEASQAKNNTTKDAAPDDLDGPCDLHDPPSQDTNPTSPRNGKPRQDFKVQSRKSASAKTSAAKQTALKSLSDEKKETKIVKGREKANAELGITGQFIQTRSAKKEQKKKELQAKKEQQQQEEEMKGAFLKELESKVQVEELDEVKE